MVAFNNIYSVRSASPRRCHVAAHSPAVEIDVATTGPRMNARKRLSFTSSASIRSGSSASSMVSFVDPAHVGPRGIHRYH
ncbi:hypothetical protein HDU97_008839 [Phlyctochytrium planicorne]|nr:hypothetical protein HDU97_008839 [Phlyctochytrium planicorne]